MQLERVIVDRCSHMNKRFRKLENTFPFKMDFKKMKTKSDRIHGCVGFAIGFESGVNIEDKLRRFGRRMSSGILFV